MSQIILFEDAQRENGQQRHTASKSKGMGGHQSKKAKNYEYLTPPEIIEACGPFDLDPCAPIKRPWPMAKHHYTIEDNGLTKPWFGRVFCNPPYGDFAKAFLRLLCDHGNGIALLFARTETEMFFSYVWQRASSILFIKERLWFHDVKGVMLPYNAGAPSALIAYGNDNVDALAESKIEGKHLLINATPVIVVAVSPCWKSVIRRVLVDAGGEAALQTIYEMCEIVAPDKVQKNRHHREKIRQQLQTSFERLKRGYYKLPNQQAA